MTPATGPAGPMAAPVYLVDQYGNISPGSDISMAAGAVALGAYLAGSLADGAITTFGAEADAAAAADNSTATYMALFKRLLAKVPVIGPQAKAASTSITFATDIPTLVASQAAAQSVSGTLQSAQNGSANGSTLNVLGMSAATWTVNMAGFTGTVNFEGTEDGTNYTALSATQLGTSTIGSTTTGSVTTAITVFECSVGGLQLIRARTSSVSAGTVTVTAHAVPVNFAPRTINVANTNTNGQATMANSAPVAIASDQTTLPVKRASVAVYSLASTAKTTTPDNSGDQSVSAYTEIGIDINTTAQTGTNPTVQFFWERKGADGIYYVLWQSAVLTAATNTLSTSVGAGMAYNQSLGITGRLRWVFGGSNTPGFTMSINIYGK